MSCHFACGKPRKGFKAAQFFEISVWANFVLHSNSNPYDPFHDRMSCGPIRQTRCRPRNRYRISHETTFPRAEPLRTAKARRDLAMVVVVVVACRGKILTRPQLASNIVSNTNSRSSGYFCAATVALSTGCHVASGSYATISLAIWSVLGPRSF
jgi:hypothetical protein